MVPSIPLEASHIVGNAQVASSLGRNLSGGATANRTINLIDKGTEFAEGWNTQLDFRVSGSYDVSGMRFQPSIDLFNAFNASTVLGVNTRYGPVWQTRRPYSAGASCGWALEWASSANMGVAGWTFWSSRRRTSHSLRLFP